MTENQISKYIVDAAIEVHRTLGGPGLLESLYEEAMDWELRKSGLLVERQMSVPVVYKVRTMSDPLRLDMLVEKKSSSKTRPSLPTTQSLKSKRGLICDCWICDSR